MTRFPYLLFFLPLAALACDPEPLRQTTPPAGEGASAPAAVSFALDEAALHVRFEVESAQVYGKAALAPGEYPYMFDVAEVFVSAAGGLPYYELELTPFGQAFAVRISVPKPGAKKVFENGVKIAGLEQKATRSPEGWAADFSIPLASLGWKGDPRKVTGNAFVILGKKPDRRYFSLSLPPQGKPDFHLPERFKPLLDCAPPEEP